MMRVLFELLFFTVLASGFIVTMLRFYRWMMNDKKKDDGKKEEKGKKGFTLIEMMIVIAIIAILAATILGAINDKQKAEQQKMTGTHFRDRAQKEEVTTQKTRTILIKCTKCGNEIEVNIVE